MLAQNADHVGSLLGGVTQLTVAAPQAAIITGAAAAAARLGAAALRLLNEITGKSIGVYRVTWFENRHHFGLGPHPAGEDRFRQDEFEFRYEIFEDTTDGPDER